MERINHKINWDLISLDELIVDAFEMRIKGITHIEIMSHYGEPDIYYNCLKETQKEIDKRLEREKFRASLKSKTEQELLDLLKNT